MNLASWKNIVGPFIQLSTFFIVYSDVWGPSSIISLFGFKYFITFMDDYSRVTWVYLLKNKSDVFVAFKSFYHMVATQFSAKLVILCSNNGGKYIFNSLSSFLDEFRIVH